MTAEQYLAAREAAEALAEHEKKLADAKKMWYNFVRVARRNRDRGGRCAVEWLQGPNSTPRILNAWGEP